MHKHAPLPDSQAGEHRAHDTHAGHSVAMFRRKFWVALLLTIPATIWGETIPHLLGFTPPVFP
ncbi:MAG TPA: hypothetical protein VKD22_12130, partial [Ramlibacter sp.]|nr:hypothetical protein [Ramlibacter sp.]